MTHEDISHPGQGDGCQRLHIELGIDPSGLERAVSEDIRNVFETGATVDHLRGGRVPERMRAQQGVTRHTRPHHGAPGQLADSGRVGQRAKRCPEVEKDAATRTRWASLGRYVAKAWPTSCDRGKTRSWWVLPAWSRSCP